MSEQFDAYYRWLGIPPKDQPPNHYRLLGVELFESNAEVIETAAERQASYLHEVSSGPHVKESQKLLNEVAAARLCLLDPEKKATYDAELQSKVTANVTVDALDDSPLDDLPWDNLEPLMNNGSSSDTVPKNQAASETLPLPAADSSTSGVYSAGNSGAFPASNSGVLGTGKSMAAAPAKPKEASQPTNRKMLWVGVGGGAALLVAVILVAMLLLGGGDDDDELKFVEGPGGPKPNNTGQTNPDKPNGQAENKKDGKRPQSSNGNKKDNGKTDNGKTDNGKTDNGKTDNGKSDPPVNGVRQPVETIVAPTDNDNGGKTDTTPKNGDSKPPVVENKQMKPDEFRTIKPLELVSLDGSTTFTVLDDNTVLAEGGQTAEDTYRIRLDTDVSDITAIKIDALPHEAIDSKGPGHGHQGGFAIVEVRVAAAPADKPADVSPVAVSGVASPQAPKIIEKIIDGKGREYWPVRRGGQETSFTLYMKDPIWHEGGTTLYLLLAQREKLGRFRVTVSNAPELKGTKTRIQADTPLFVNLGGKAKKDTAGKDWQATGPYENGPFGYVGGAEDGHDLLVPFSSCISGIKEFRVNLPDGKYNVRLLFSGRTPKDMSRRSFSVIAPGLEKPYRIPSIHPRQVGYPVQLPNLEAKDGVLTIEFIPDKGESVLNGIEIYEAK